MRNYGSTKIFYEIELNNYLNEKNQLVNKTVESENDEYLLNVNEKDYIDHLLSIAYVEPLVINFDDISVTSKEKMIPAEYFPSDFNVYSGKSYKKSVITFSIPFSGDSNLLRCTPSTRIMWTEEVIIGNDEISFERINFYDDPQVIIREKDSFVRNSLQQFNYLKSDLTSYNNNLENNLRQILQNRKQRILKNHNLLASLGVPVKKSGSTSKTFSIPSPEMRKKIVFKKPDVKGNLYTPEPTLDDSIYIQILNVIHDVGKEFERLPSVYINKEEEHLRDHFLMMLEPNFEGSATGETFNKTGKTDILLRYDGSNVFIAECKFWRGQKGFLDTITQLLSYLTWRDSKAAIIIFVPNKNFSSVIEEMKSNISNHLNYIDFINTKDETWFNYTFHIPNDRNRIVKIAVMLYHLPK